MSNINETIQYGIACGPKSEKLIYFLIKTFILTVNNINNFEFLLGITQFVDEQLLKKMLSVYENDVKIKYINCKNTLPIGSMSHGTTLDILFSNMTSKFGIVSDCDVAFLMKNWDETFKNKLNDNIIIIGTEYEPYYRKSNNIVINKYKNFPCAYFCFFLVDKLRALNLSWKPHANINIFLNKIKTNSLTREDPTSFGCIEINSNNQNIFHPVNNGNLLLMDTGIELILKIKPTNYKYITLKFDSKTFKKLKSAQIQEYTFNNIPFLTHFKKCRGNKNMLIIRSWKNIIMSLIRP